MNILFAVAECTPFVKSGGLADVAGALPKELQAMGIDVRVILPNYATIPESFQNQKILKKVIHVQLGWRNQYCGIFELHHEGITYYLLDNEYYFNRDRLYGHYDDGERFSFFSKAILEVLPHLDFIPDVLHCHDWHTAMASYLLREQYDTPFYRAIKTVYTIHNLQFQGVYAREMIHDFFGLDETHVTLEKLEFYQDINFMKGGIVASDVITTVSPTYQQEIQHHFFGERLEGLLRHYQHKLVGILNGIDTDLYNPATDDSLSVPYDADNLAGKAVNKQALQRYFELPEKEDVPIIAMVTRLTKQKGIDLVRHVLHEILTEDVQLIVVGSGDEEYEDFFRYIEHHYPQKVKVFIGFHEELAHRVYAGADLFLMPSLFEPCGLGQLIALRYGALPIVRETGGLNDTVQSYQEATGEGNGFSFTNFNAHDMLHTVRRSLYYYKQKTIWEAIVQQAMRQDYSWKQSAYLYKKLYEELTNGSEPYVFK